VTATTTTTITATNTPAGSNSRAVKGKEHSPRGDIDELYPLISLHGQGEVVKVSCR